MPGEGPRSGWFGNEDWGRDYERSTWEVYAEETDTSLTRNEWLRNYMPDWLNTDLGEQTPQAREQT